MTIPAKILYVHHGSGEGGAANSLLYLLQNLDRNRFEPLVACNIETPNTREYFSTHGFEPFHLPLAPIAHTSKTWELHTPRGLAKFIQWLFFRQPVARRSFERLLDEVKPNLVHLNGVSLLPLARTSKSIGVPVVQHIRESVNAGQFGLRRKWLCRLALQNTAHIVYICKDGRERFPVPTNTYSVIYNPVPFDKFQVGERSHHRRALDIPVDSTVLFFPGGSMLDIKGIIPFLLAFSKIRARYSDVLAIIPGIDGVAHPRDKVRHRMENIIADNKLEEAILRVPFSNEVEHYYSASDVVVVPFVTPHFSRAVIEAGAMAKPVVGSRIGGIEEVLEDCAAGLLATPNDPDDLALKLGSLIENRARAVAMGQAGYSISREKFDVANHARAVMRIYDHVLLTSGAAK